MDPKNFEIIPGSPESPVILHVPHSARFIPADVRSGILLDDTQLNAELDSMTDSLTDSIALQASERAELRPWIFINTFSRLVIDPERFPDEREVMNKVGMGAVYRKSSTGLDLRASDFSDEKVLLDSFFHPYANALEALVSERLAALGGITIIDVHSYRTEQHENAVNHGQKRPAMCIGTDEFHTPPWLIECAQAAFAPLGETFLNEPYAGTYIPLKFYGVNSAVQSIMMETRADTFLDDKLKMHEGAIDVVTGLTSLIDQVKLAVHRKHDPGAISW